MPTIAFSVPSPVAQPRHRVGAGSAGGRPRAYLPKAHPVHAFKGDARSAARDAMAGLDPFCCPVRLTAVFVLPRPSRLAWKRRPTPRVFAPVKPDLSNLVKSLEDAMTGVVWVDDAQVVEARLGKWHAAGGEPAHVEVTVETLEEVDGGRAK